MSHSPEYVESCCLLQSISLFLGWQKLEENEVAVYLNAIGSTDGKAVVAALRHWLANERSFPAPVDIRQIIEQAKEAA